MPASVLVAYATRYGSTQEVAEAVAATLRESGLKVDSQPMREVRTLERYRAVIVGTAIYMFRLHKDARRFLSRHREALSTRPVAIFAMGPLHNDEKEQAVREQFDKELAQFPWFTPIARGIFGGKLTQRTSTSLSISCPPSNRCRPATFETGQRSAPGRATWQRRFSLFCLRQANSQRSNIISFTTQRYE